LTHQKTAFIDAEDFDRIRNHTWRAVQAHRCWYAKTTVGSPPRQVDLSMHRMIAKTQRPQVCHHLNRNSLDNRKANLRNMDKFDHQLLHLTDNITIKFADKTSEKPADTQNAPPTTST